MTSYMVNSLGVKEEDIFLEEKAISTCTNAKNTLEIMESKPNWIGKNTELWIGKTKFIFLFLILFLFQRKILKEGLLTFC